MSTSKAGLSAAGSVIAALAASVCCTGPVVLALAGLGGAASALALAPYRPYFLALSAVLLGAGFYRTYARRSLSCHPGRECDNPGAGPAGKAILWLAALTLIVSITLPVFATRPPGADDPRARPAARRPTAARAAMKNARLGITGMTCGGCVARVEERLARVGGVSGFEVSLEENEARISYDPATTNPDAIAAAVSETGFAAVVKARDEP